MSEKRRNSTDEFKREAIRLVTEHGYGVSATARNVGINATRLGRWKRAVDTKPSAACPGNGRLPLDQEALDR